MDKAKAVQAQIDTLSAWVQELSENFDDDLDQVVPFDYSPELAAAMQLHGISDPHRAWVVFNERAGALRACLASFRRAAAVGTDRRRL